MKLLKYSPRFLIRSKIQQTLLLLILSLLMVPFNGCVKEVERVFPRVTTLSGEVLENGIKMRGEIDNLESIEIEDYGFVVGKGMFDQQNELIYYSLGGEPSTSQFETTVTNGLYKGSTYFYMAYARSEGFITFGEDITFVSGGSDPHLLIDFNPKSGQAGDTVNLVCDNLFGPPYYYGVTFEDEEAKIISISDTSITVRVPEELVKKDVQITVLGYGNYVNFTTPFTRLNPIIDSFSPASVYPNDEVTILGSNFPYPSQFFTVYFGDIVAEIVSSSRNKIVVKAPVTEEAFNKIKINRFGLEAVSLLDIENLFTINATIEQDNGAFGNQISIKGRGVASYPVKWINIGGINTGSFSLLADEILTNIPNHLEDCEAEVVITYNFGNVTCDNHLFIDPPVITGFSDTEIKAGEEFSIYGENFSLTNSYNTISMGSIEFNPIYSSSTELIVIAPSSLEEGSYTPGVKTCGDYVYSAVPINILTPLWIRVASYPGGPTFRAGAFSIDGYGYAGMGHAGSLSGSYSYDFYRYDPANNQWTQLENYPGIGSYSPVAAVINNIGYVGGGVNPSYIPYSPTNYYSYNPSTNSWTQILDNPSPTDGTYGEFYEVIDNKLYVSASGTTMHTLEADPITWTDVSGSMPEFWHGCASFVLDGKMYVIFGRNSQTTALKREVWVYNPIDSSWERKNDFPGTARVGASGFSIGDRGYMGFGWDGGANYLADIWEYDNNTDTWTRLGLDYPDGPISMPFVFQIGDCAYIGTGITTGKVYTNQVFKFTPSVN